MGMLTQYIVKIFLRNLALSLGCFAGVYMLVDFLERVDNFVEKSAPLGLYIEYGINVIPLFIAQVAPLATLMAAFITIGSLSRTGELTAMRAGGNEPLPHHPSDYRNHLLVHSCPVRDPGTGSPQKHQHHEPHHESTNQGKIPTTKNSQSNLGPDRRQYCPH